MRRRRTAPRKQPQTSLSSCKVEVPREVRQEGQEQDVEMQPVDEDDAASACNTIKVCGTDFCFKHVKGVLMQEVRACFKKHEARVESVQGGVSGFEKLKEEHEQLQVSGSVPKWCQAKQVMPAKHKMLQEPAPTLSVTSADGTKRNLRAELIRECPWLQHVLDN